LKAELLSHLVALPPAESPIKSPTAQPPSECVNAEQESIILFKQKPSYDKPPVERSIDELSILPAYIDQLMEKKKPKSDTTKQSSTSTENTQPTKPFDDITPFSCSLVQAYFSCSFLLLLLLLLL